MNGVVLNRTNDRIFDFYSDMIEEVIDYCKKQGFAQIDKIIFISSYDTDITDGPKSNIKMQGDSKISIIKEGENIIARVCICEWVEIKENWKKYV